MLMFSVAACGNKAEPPAQELSLEQKDKIKKTTSALSSALLSDDVEGEMAKLINALAENNIEYVMKTGTDEFLAVKDIEGKLTSLVEKYVIKGEALDTVLLDANVGKKWTLRTGASTIYRAKYERVFAEEKNVFTITLIRTKKHACCQLQHIDIRLHKPAPEHDAIKEKSEIQPNAEGQVEQ